MEFLRASLILFLSGITIAAGGFVFWLVASQLMSVEEIGYATTSISSVSVISSFSALGLEYTLLKRTSQDRGKIAGTLFLFEIIANLSIVPMVFFVSNPFDRPAIHMLAALIFVANGVAFIPKSAMLGMMDAKIVIMYDTTAFAARFATLATFALLGFGAIAILLSLLVHSAILSAVFGITMFRRLGFSLGSLSYLKTVLKEGLSNFPTRLSRLIVTNLGVLLFAYVSLDPALVGIFYIAVMISVVGSELATNLSLMAIPASASKGKEVVLYSTRLSLILQAPIIAVLLSVPAFIMGLIGKDYSQGGTSLFILTLSIIPTTLILNGVAKFNAEAKFRKAATMGIIEITVFLSLFFPLAMQYSIDGVAMAILISYIASGAYAARAFGRQTIVTTGIASLAIASGYLLSTALGLLYDNPYLKIAISVFVALAIPVAMRAISITEIRSIASQLLAGKKSV